MPGCPLIAAGTTLRICVILVVVLCCSTHVCCGMEHGVAYCAKHRTAIATLTIYTFMDHVLTSTNVLCTWMSLRLLVLHVIVCYVKLDMQN